jgi:small-conductance mechanosensitive channel
LNNLQEEFFRLRGLESDYQKQIQGEKEQNKKLFTLLSQAEMEMERSAKQIREMSSALSRLQQQEADANEKAKALGGESIKAQKELERSQKDIIGERQDTQLRLSQLTETLRNKESQLSEATDQL